MNLFKLLGGLLLFACLIFSPEIGFSQITSVADEVVSTEYSSGAQDQIHIFCGQKGALNAALIANSPNNEPASFEWQKYNPLTGNFDFRSTESSGNTTSSISGLEDGGYRVKVTSTSGEKTYTAWVFNNYIESKAEITDSDCNSLTLKSSFDTPKLIYTDLPTGQSKELSKDLKVRWLDAEVVVSRVLVSKVFDPPTKDTDYTLEVTDKFGCVAEADIYYLSIATKASFEFSLPDKKSDHNLNEAPLTVTFTNTSENGDAGKFEWFIFKDLDKIKQESEANNGVVKDSILVVLYNDSPVYTFEETGSYMVKLVSKKLAEFTTCTDTFYMSDYIVIGESFIDAPNVFTPDGNDVNDIFAVKFFSMKTVKITIFNRWGKVLHVYNNNNVQGFYNTASSIPESVWDGKVGGRLATPGVYYYVAEGIGRDGKKRSTNGFFHLFRGK